MLRLVRERRFNRPQRAALYLLVGILVTFFYILGYLSHPMYKYFGQNESNHIITTTSSFQTTLAHLNYSFEQNLSMSLFYSSVDLSNEVREAMNHSWRAYKDYAWGMDEVSPLSEKGTIWMDASLTMIDSLDTLMILEMKEEVHEACEWIANNVTFQLDDDNTNLFESTIRLLGGLLSAYHISEDARFLTKANLLALKLLPAFNSKSGLPYPQINFATRKAQMVSWTSQYNLAEVSTLQLEFNDLAVSLKQKSISETVAKVFHYLHRLPKLDGLLPTLFDAKIKNSKMDYAYSIGARGDSHYEYLLKVWIQTGKRCKLIEADYRAAIRGIKRKLLHKSKPNKLYFAGEYILGIFYPKMDSLACFLPGMLALGYLHGMPASHLDLAKLLMRTCFLINNRTATGLSPEIVHFNINDDDTLDDFFIKADSSQNLLRPETVESLFYLYYITLDPIYRTWGGFIFRSFQKYARLRKVGYASLQDVSQTNSQHLNKMESFWLAETLKYFYLLFNETAAKHFPLDKWIFNTEAHPLPISTREEDLTLLTSAYKC